MLHHLRSSNHRTCHLRKVTINLSSSSNTPYCAHYPPSLILTNMKSSSLLRVSLLTALALPRSRTQSANSSTCNTPTGFTNTLVRAPIPNAPQLSLPIAFITSHILFTITDLNTRLPQAAFGQFCLDQCVAHAGEKPCLSFTVDQGVPQPGAPTDGNATARRWWCEGFDVFLKEDLSDFEGFEGEESFGWGVAVNRGCERAEGGRGGGYRFF